MAHMVLIVWGVEPFSEMADLHQARSKNKELKVGWLHPTWHRSVVVPRHAASCACGKSQSRCVCKKAPCTAGSQLFLRGSLVLCLIHLPHHCLSRWEKIDVHYFQYNSYFSRHADRLQKLDLLEGFSTNLLPVAVTGFLGLHPMPLIQRWQICFAFFKVFLLVDLSELKNRFDEY